MERSIVAVMARLGATDPYFAALALMACGEGIILHRIARHDTTDPRPLLRVASTPPSLIDSRAGMVTGSTGPGLPARSRLDHDVAAGNDDAAHFEDFRRLLSRWLR